MTHIRLTNQELEEYLTTPEQRLKKLSQQVWQTELLLEMALETMREMDDSSDTDLHHLFSDFEDEYSDYLMFKE